MLKVVLILCFVLGSLGAQTGWSCNTAGAGLQMWLTDSPPAWSSVTCGSATPIVRQWYSSIYGFWITGPANAYFEIWTSNPAPVENTLFCNGNAVNLVSDRSYFKVTSGYLNSSGWMIENVDFNVDSGERWSFQAYVFSSGGCGVNLSAVIYYENGPVP